MKVERLESFEGLEPCRIRVGDTVLRIDQPSTHLYRVREIRRLRRRIECDLVDVAGRTFVVMVVGASYRSQVTGDWVHRERLLRVDLADRST